MTLAPALPTASRPQGAALPRRRFPLLDSVRALAALLVILYHGTEGGLRLDAWDAPLGERLNVVAVPMFMALSGFLLYRPFVAARAAGRSEPSLVRYAAGRVLRIGPGYWVALLVLTGALGLQGDVLGARWWVYFGFLQTYVDWTALQGLSHAWTLCLEVSFYVALAGWLVVARRYRPRLWQEVAVLTLLALGSLVLQLEYYERGGTQGNLDLTLPANFFMFSAGMALAVASLDRPGRQGFLRRLLTRRPGLCWIAAAAVYWYLCYPLGLPPRGSAIQAYSAAGWLQEQVLGAVVALLVMLPAVFDEQGGGIPGAVLRLPALRALGTVSYGLYLYHLAALAWVDEVVGHVRTYDRLALDLLLGTALSALLAAASWFVVEKPFLDLLPPASPAPRREQRRGQHAGEGAAGHRHEERSRPLAVPLQRQLQSWMVGDDDGPPARGGGAVGAGDRSRSAGVVGAAHVDDLEGSAASDEEIAIGQGARPERSRLQAEQAVGVGGVHTAARAPSGWDGGDAGDAVQAAHRIPAAHRQEPRGALRRHGEDAVVIDERRAPTGTLAGGRGQHGEHRREAAEAECNGVAPAPTVDHVDCQAAGLQGGDQEGVPEAAHGVEDGRAGAGAGQRPERRGGPRGVEPMQRGGLQPGRGYEDVIRPERAEGVTAVGGGDGEEGRTSSRAPQVGHRLGSVGVGSALAIDQAQTASATGDEQAVGADTGEVADSRCRGKAGRHHGRQWVSDLLRRGRTRRRHQRAHDCYGDRDCRCNPHGGVERR